MFFEMGRIIYKEIMIPIRKRLTVLINKDYIESKTNIMSIFVFISYDKRLSQFQFSISQSSNNSAHFSAVTVQLIPNDVKSKNSSVHLSFGTCSLDNLS